MSAMDAVIRIQKLSSRIDRKQDPLAYAQGRLAREKAGNKSVLRKNMVVLVSVLAGLGLVILVFGILTQGGTVLFFYISVSLLFIIAAAMPWVLYRMRDTRMEILRRYVTEVTGASD